jgi:hypothetical protein
MLVVGFEYILVAPVVDLLVFYCAFVFIFVLGDYDPLLALVVFVVLGWHNKLILIGMNCF